MDKDEKPSSEKYNFLKDYLLYNSGNEAPMSYHLWTAFAVLSSATSRRVWIHQGYYLVFTNIYVCLVGKQGTRKTTAKDQGYDLLRDSLRTEIPIAAESMSKEAITKFLSHEDQMRTFKDPTTGEILEYHPFTIFSTELKNFLSINPITMLDFLTTIYDRGHSAYDVKTKNKGEDYIMRPHVTFLACETPDWIRMRLKENIISGGFSRRMNFIYETVREKKIAFPQILPEQKEAYVRMRKHLQKLWGISGEFKWQPSAIKWYGNWYNGLKIPTDNPLIEGFYESIHIGVLKLAMLLACCEEDIVLEVTEKNLISAKDFIEALVPNLYKLSEGYGQNKLAAPSSKMLDLIDIHSGIMPLIKLKKLMWQDLQGRDFQEALEHFKKTSQLFELKSPTGELVICNKNGLEVLKDRLKIKT